MSSNSHCRKWQWEFFIHIRSKIILIMSFLQLKSTNNLIEIVYFLYLIYFLNLVYFLYKLKNERCGCDSNLSIFRSFLSHTRKEMERSHHPLFIPLQGWHSPLYGNKTGHSRYYIKSTIVKIN